MEEIWKPVLGYENLYEASNLGKIRSCNKFKNWRLLKEYNTGKNGNIGYCQVKLYKNNTKKSCVVHRLVWEAFNGAIPEKMQVNHIDENKTNNILSNLNLLNNRDNCAWGTRTKRIVEKHELPILQYDLDGNFIQEFKSIKEATNHIGAKGHYCIGYCCKGVQKTAYGYIWKFKKEV